MKSIAKRINGFTLMELTMVIAILAILMMIAVPTYITIKRDAEDAEVKADMLSLKNAFNVSSIVNNSIGKAAIAPGTIVNVLSDINGNVIDPNTVKLYSIDASISSYYNKLNKSLDDFMVDSANNVYYRGKFNGMVGSLSAKLESDIGASVATKNLSGDLISGRYG
ncbi:MAG: prepilin-type N-terminal cleavage/methylation domain-containing protein, partial [Firmicutes bacterium]|nr:prepilin-type N-terminal cleavage/methylation domain-containing protein [Bacillota bacterium]